MARTIFITGGARSGKSRLAEEIASTYGAPLGYLATGTAGDREMEERIGLHRARRGETWCTIEEPYALTEVVRAQDGRYRALLVDCITLWIANLLLRDNDPDGVMGCVKELTSLCAVLTTPLLLVSNEVGMGIVPEHPLARTFRDLSGEANQLLAAAADEVHMVVAGLSVRLKG